MASKFWLSDKFEYHKGTAIHQLLTGTYKLALVLSTATTPEDTWATATAYVTGNVVVPTTRNGHRYICTVAGTSTSEPSWPTTDGGTVGSSPQWTEYGGDMCAHDLWADFSAYEAATGSGYTTGGETITTPALTTVYRTTSWDADDVTWTSLTKVFRYAVLYRSGTVDGVINPIVGYALLDDSYADLSISGINYRLYWSSLGIAKAVTS